MAAGFSPAGPEAPVSPIAAPDGPAAVGEPAAHSSGQNNEDDMDVEEQKPKLPSKISAPSQQDKEEHEAAGHATYRPWCPHCVAGKGQANPHRATTTECEFPELFADYGYMGRDKAKCLPIIIAKDDKTNSYAASCVEKKGANSYAVSYVSSWLKGFGLQEAYHATRQRACTFSTFGGGP